MESMHEKVKRAKTGDPIAFGELVKMFQDAVYGVAYSMLGNFEDAQDIAQDVFLQAWCHLSSLKEETKFPNWLFRITKNRCMNFLKQAKLDIAELEEAYTVQDRLPGPLEQIEKKELADRVLASVRVLPEQLRLTTTLFYINGYTVNEIAEFLEAPAGTIKRRLHDSRQRLKESIMKDKKMIEIMVDGALKSFPLPGDFADVVVRLVASEEDLNGLVELGFGRPKSVTHGQQDEMFVVGEEGQVESAGHLGETTWGIGSTIVKAARSMIVAGEGEGVPSPVLVKGYQGHFKLCREAGIRLALVHGTHFDHAFCGFVPCFYHAFATVPRERVKSIATRATVREVRDEKEKEAGWEAFMRDPYVEKIGGWCPGPMTHVVEQDGVPVGYLSRDVGNHTFKTREAALAAMKFGEGDTVYSMDSHMAVLTQTILSLGGTYRLRPSCDVVGLDNEMVAIIDFVGLTQDLQGEFQLRLNTSPAHHISGRFSIEMSSTNIGFAVNSGRVEIVTQKQKVHRVLPRWVVTRLYMGYYSGEDVLSMGPIPHDRSDGKNPDDPDLDMKELHLPENEAAIFKALFPKLWPCSGPDPEVWSWVMGEEHLQYRPGMTPEMKAPIDTLRFPWIGY
jgi:RNA polymerase sigma-70 factor (ECF subfamily)